MKRLLSILLCTVLLLGLLPFQVGLFANAASPSQITDGTTYTVEWDASTGIKYLYLTVSETGFYDLSINDLNQTATLWFDLVNMDSEKTPSELDDRGYYTNFETATHSLKNIQLFSGHLYEISLEYDNYDDYYEEYVPEDASITITFTKTNYAPTSLNLGTNNNIWTTLDEYNWYEFETTTAGDYLFESSLYTDTYFAIYEKNTGVWVDSFNFYSTVTNRTTLKASTKYVVCSATNDTDERLMRLRLSKSSTDISKIEIAQNPVILGDDGYIYSDIGYIYNSDIEEISYMVTFSNRTTRVYSYYDLLDLGISIDEIEYLGEIVEDDGEYIFAAGNQPVVIYYGNASSESSIYITSYVEWLANENISITTDFDDMTISYESDEEYTYYWRLKPQQTNMYDFYSSDWGELYTTFTIFDDKNHVVPYTNDGWNLHAGKEYALKITYTYKEDSYGIDVDFNMEPYREHVHSFGNYIYNNDATEQKDGTKTRTCSVCGNKETITAEGTKITKPTPTPTPNPKPSVIIKDTSKIFNDIKSNAWYKQFVDYAVAYGLFSGTSESTFSPSTDMTRAQFVQVLANLSGAKLDNNVSTGFTDAPAGKWFTGAVKWATSNGIASGVGNGQFNPTGKIDRQQMCMMLVNYVENYKKTSLKEKVAYKTFADDKEIAGWAKTAVIKCFKAGLVSGTGNNMFSPKVVANRATGATIFTNFHKEYMA